MTTITQGIEQLEWLLTDSGTRSRDGETVVVAGGVALPSGTVLGRITASGKLARYVDANTDGTQTAAAVLINAVPGVNGDHKVAVVSRDAEVFGAMLNGGSGVDANGRADLRAQGIIVR